MNYMNADRFLPSICRAVACMLALALAAASGIAYAQKYPERPVHMVVPFPPGGAADVFARLLAQNLEGRLGQPVVVENVTGASGTIGAKNVIRSPADGYRLLVGTVNLLAFPPALVPGMDYDSQKDLVPVSKLYVAPLVVVTNANTGPKTMAEFVAGAKAADGKWSYGSYGNATTSQFCMEALASRAGVKLVHVPYRTLPVLDLVGGRIQAVCDLIPQVSGHVSGGTVRPLGVTTSAGTPLMAGVPTVAEQGFPGFEITTWSALLAPKGTPPAVVARLNEAVAAALQSPELRKRADALGVEPQASTPEELAAFMKADAARWARIARDAAIK